MGYPSYQSVNLLLAICKNNVEELKSFVISSGKYFDHKEINSFFSIPGKKKFIRPLQLALHLSPVKEEIILFLLEKGAKPTSEEISLFEEKKAQINSPVLNKNFEEATQGALDSGPLLKQLPKVGLTKRNINQLWLVSCEEGDISLSNYLLSMQAINTSSFRRGLSIAKQLHHERFIASLVTQPLLTKKDKESLLDFSVTNNYKVIAKEIIKLNLSKTQEVKKPGFFASVVNPIKKILAKIFYKDSAANMNQKLLIAVQGKKEKIVEALLADKQFIITIDQTILLLETLFDKNAFSIPKENRKLAKVLLADVRIKKALSHFPLTKLTNLLLASGHIELIQELIKHYQFNEFEVSSFIIYPAIAQGEELLLKALLPKIEITAHLLKYDMVLLAIKNGHPEIVTLLLKDKKNYFNLEESKKLLEVALSKDKNIAKLLLKELLLSEALQITFDNAKLLLNWALAEGDIEIIYLLTQHLQLTSEQINNIIINPLIEKDFVSLLTELIKNKTLVDPIKNTNNDIVIPHNHRKFINDLELALGRKQSSEVYLTKLLVALQDAASRGYIEEVASLSQNNIEQVLNKFIPLRLFAPHLDDTEKAEQFLSTPNIESSLINLAFFLISQVSHSKVVIQTFLKDPRVDPVSKNNAVFCIAAGNGNLEMVNTLLKDSRVISACNYQANNGQLPSNYQPIRLAARNGHLPMVQSLIARQSDPSLYNGYAIIAAAQYGHLHIIQALLKSSRPILPIVSDYAMYLAITNGHLDIVKTLLNDPKIQSSFNNDRNSIVIHNAIKKGHTEIVKLLLQNKHINPAVGVKNNEIVESNKALYLAIKNGHLDIVKALLEDQRIDPSFNDNKAICLAVDIGNLEMVEVLLKDQRVNPTARNNYVLFTALQYGHLEMVQILLKDRRVDPSVQNNRLINLAVDRGFVEIVSTLVVHPKVSTEKDPNLLLAMTAINKGDLENLKTLLLTQRICLTDKTVSLFEKAANIESPPHEKINVIKLLLAFTPEEHFEETWKYCKDVLSRSANRFSLSFSSKHLNQLSNEVKCLKLILSIATPFNQEFKTHDLLQLAGLLYTSKDKFQFMQSMISLLAPNTVMDQLKDAANNLYLIAHTADKGARITLKEKMSVSNNDSMISRELEKQLFEALNKEIKMSSEKPIERGVRNVFDQYANQIRTLASQLYDRAKHPDFLSKRAQPAQVSAAGLNR